MEKKYSVTDYAIWVVLLAGVGLALTQFVLNRSIGGDEATLGLNILTRDFAGLLKPLDDNQVAPILVLWLQKAATLLVPHTEMGFRIVPLMAWCLSLAFFWGILRSVLTSKPAILFALALFILDQTLLRYSNEGKQYIFDVLVMTSMGYLVLSKPRLRLLLLGVGGVLAVFLSNIAPIVLLGCGLAMLYECWRGQWKTLLPMAIIAVVWAAAFGFYYLLFINHHPTRAMMESYWDHQGAFMPWNPLKKHFWTFAKGLVATLFRDVLKFGLVGVVLLGALYATGLYTLVRRMRIEVALVLVLPLLVHLALSLLHIYPVATRLILYVAPALLVVAALGLERLLEIRWVAEHSKVTRWLVPVLLVLAAVTFVRQGLPADRRELRQGIDYLTAKAGEDTVYWFYRGKGQLAFYEKLGYPLPAHNVVGAPHPGAPDQISAELTAIHGRTWLLFSFVKPRSEMTIVMDSLAPKGVTPISTFHNHDADIYLVNLP